MVCLSSNTSMDKEVMVRHHYKNVTKKLVASAIFHKDGPKKRYSSILKKSKA